MTITTGEKHAVILSGGGANGAYEVGVLKALFAGKSEATSGQPLDPAIFAGTSVGSYNAAFLVSRWDVYGTAAIGSLEQLWLDDVASSAQKPDNGVFRIREDPREFINPRSYIPNPLQPFYHLVSDSASLAWEGFQRVANIATAQRTPLLERLVQLFDFTSFIVLDPFRQLINNTVWFSEIRRSQKQLIVVATNWELGKVRIFKNHDMTDHLGSLAILGSTAIPGVFPPIAIGAQRFVDGGVLLNSPLEPVIDDGGRVLHVISLFADVENIPLATMDNTLATIYRQQIISWAQSIESSIRRVRDINRALDIAVLASKAVQMMKEKFSAEDLESLRIKAIEEHLERYKAYIPVTVHRYYPGDDVSGALGLLDFDCDRIRNLIEQGFEDAVEHNCENNKCVKPFPASSTAVAAAQDGLFEL